jgi:hypothetical protein
MFRDDMALQFDVDPLDNMFQHSKMTSHVN